MSSKIFYVGGMKGGVGKSLCAHAVVDALIAKGDTPLLVETDTANPDLFKCYNGIIPVELCSLNSETDDAGWRTFISLLAETTDKPIVVNTPAQNNVGFATFGPLLNSMPGLSERLIPFWVVDAGRDCLELLADFMEIMDAVKAVHIVKNGYHAKESGFTLLDESKLKKKLTANGGQILFMPKLLASAAGMIYSERKSIATILDSQIDFGLRVFLESWRGIMHKNLSGVLV
jgi:Oxyanion-translocating ATPase